MSAQTGEPREPRGLLGWLDKRLPVIDFYKSSLTEYYAPKNFNIWYYFGSILLLVLVIQIITGIWLTMSYKPDATQAFNSVEYIMRDVPWGWLIRYLHSTGASAFFFAVYLHMFRGLIYGSYRKPRELLWLIGMLIYLALMAEAFFGYLLPWGQMSYWGAQVITSLFGAIPVIGPGLTEWIRGDYAVSDVTLNRFFAFHVVLMPLLILGLVGLHLVALRRVGSNNPDGIEIKENKGPDGIPVDGIPFHPYYTIKDLVGFGIFLLVFAAVVFFSPELGGWFLEHNNFVSADQLKTPEEIAPLWYLTPFYAILRAIPNKLGGIIAMALAIFLPFLLPWLDRSPVKSIRYRGLVYKIMIGAFVVSFLGLGYLGTVRPGGIYTLMARVFSVIYFAFFLLMPVYSRFDKNKTAPDRLRP